MEQGTKQKKNTMTKECIFTALLLLMEQKPYEEITITDIAKKAGVSRMSYYRLYKSKEDILIQYSNEIFEKCLEQIKSMERIDKFRFAQIIFITCRDHDRLIKGIFHAKLYEMIFRRFVSYCTYMAEHVFGLDMKKAETDYWIHGEAGKFCLLIFRWIENGMPESPEEMAGFATADAEGF